jgi:predicted nucleic acid-binding protein
VILSKSKELVHISDWSASNFIKINQLKFRLVRVAEKDINREELVMSYSSAMDVSYSLKDLPYLASYVFF